MKRSKSLDAFFATFLGQRIPAVIGFVLTVLMGALYWALYIPVYLLYRAYLVTLFLHESGKGMNAAVIAFKEGRHVEP